MLGGGGADGGKISIIIHYFKFCDRIRTGFDFVCVFLLAIHRAAGPDLMQACYGVPEVRPGVRCPTGESRITP